MISFAETVLGVTNAHEQQETAASYAESVLCVTEASTLMMNINTAMSLYGEAEGESKEGVGTKIKNWFIKLIEKIVYYCKKILGFGETAKAITKENVLETLKINGTDALLNTTKSKFSEDAKLGKVIDRILAGEYKNTKQFRNDVIAVYNILKDKGGSLEEYVASKTDKKFKVSTPLANAAKDMNGTVDTAIDNISELIIKLANDRADLGKTKGAKTKEEKASLQDTLKGMIPPVVSDIVAELKKVFNFESISIEPDTNKIINVKFGMSEHLMSYASDKGITDRLVLKNISMSAEFNTFIKKLAKFIKQLENTTKVINTISFYTENDVLTPLISALSTLFAGITLIDGNYNMGYDVGVLTLILENANK